MYKRRIEVPKSYKKGMNECINAKMDKLELSDVGCRMLEEGRSICAIRVSLTAFAKSIAVAKALAEATSFVGRRKLEEGSGKREE